MASSLQFPPLSCGTVPTSGPWLPVAFGLSALMPALWWLVALCRRQGSTGTGADPESEAEGRGYQSLAKSPLVEEGYDDDVDESTSIPEWILKSRVPLASRQSI